MNEYKSGLSLLWDEKAKYKEQKWPELKDRILNTQGGIGIIVDDFLEMLRYRGAPFGSKTDILREAFTRLTLDASGEDDIALLADILAVMMRKPWDTNIDGGFFIAHLRKKENSKEFDAERATLVVNHMYGIHEYPAIVLCKTLTQFTESFDEPILTLLDKMRRTGKFTRELIMTIDPAKVFISYIREDEAKAEKLRATLNARDIHAWKDTHELLPGEKWEHKIKKALKENDFVILCLSNASIAKTGFFQVEVKEALRWQKYRPDSQVYIIPIKFDHCELPTEIEGLHYVDMFQNWDEGINAITKTVLEYRKRSEGQSTQ